MKAALLASFFMLLLQVGHFFASQPSVRGGNQKFYQVEPGGAESYEYTDEEVKEKVDDVEDGDRLVGGKVTTTRSTRVSEVGKFRSGDFLSWSAGTGMEWTTGWAAVVRDFFLFTSDNESSQ